MTVDLDASLCDVLASFSLTPGHGRSAEQASACPGDSGGAVYRDDGASRTIVGVYAYYSFKYPAQDPDGISVTNWHTRLDRHSRFEVGRWLKGLGVNVVQSADPDVAMGEIVCPSGYELVSVGEQGGMLCIDVAEHHAYAPLPEP